MNELEENFNSRGFSVSDSGCWVWLGSKNSAGYGRMKIRGVHYFAHRVSYMIHKGIIPDGFVICHSCDNPSCVNPSHLWAGTNGENQRDCTKKGRRATGARHRSALYPESIPRGEQTGRATLTENQVREIRRLAGTMSQQAIADMFGTPQTNVSRIIRGVAWRHVK